MELSWSVVRLRFSIIASQREARGETVRLVQPNKSETTAMMSIFCTSYPSFSLVVYLLNNYILYRSANQEKNAYRAGQGVDSGKLGDWGFGLAYFDSK